MLKAYKRYFKQALIDLDANDLEMKRVIAENIKDKLEKARDLFTAEELNEIMALFTQSEQGKRRIVSDEIGLRFKHSFSVKVTIRVKKANNGNPERYITALNFEHDSEGLNGEYSPAKISITDYKLIRKFK